MRLTFDLARYRLPSKLLNPHPYSTKRWSYWVSPYNVPSNGTGLA
jgi:hypothetical protein